MIYTYIADNGAPPRGLDDLVTRPAEAANWMGPYAVERDLNDAWGRRFLYRQPGTHGDFDLGSYGADGKPGGEGLRAADIGTP